MKLKAGPNKKSANDIDTENVTENEHLELLRGVFPKITIKSLL